MQRADHTTSQCRSLVLLAVTLLTLFHCSNGLSVDKSSRSAWRPLPHVPDRREILASGAAIATGATAGSGGGGILPPVANAAETTALDGQGQRNNIRSVASINSHPVIPVWPSWAGGRVVPVSFSNDNEDPFLLLAHHKHWFDPRDPFREPFKAVGKSLGLPYVDVEGFSMHPHRGMDILTYVLDGSDGFRHKDSLGGSRIYRGGCAQWMRTGAGVMHQEFWETREDRRTNIELFQLWVNLPSQQKFDPPAVRYVGASTDAPWKEQQQKGVHVRDVGSTLEAALQKNVDNNKDEVKERPPIQIQHIQILMGASWDIAVPSTHSAMIYVREGTALLGSNEVKSLQSATFNSDGDAVRLRNTQRRTLDLLFLSGKPLREPVAMGGPIVMNTEQEIYDAYRQLSDGTFLDRDVALQQQSVTSKRFG